MNAGGPLTLLCEACERQGGKKTLVLTSVKPCSAWARSVPLTHLPAPSGPGCDTGPDHGGHRGPGWEEEGHLPTARGQTHVSGQPSVSLGWRTPGSPGRRVSLEAHTCTGVPSKPLETNPCTKGLDTELYALYPFWTTTRRPPWACHVVACRACRNLAFDGRLALWRPSGTVEALRGGRGAAELPPPGSGESLLGWERPPWLAGTLASAGQSLLQASDEPGCTRSAAPAFQCRVGRAGRGRSRRPRVRAGGPCGKLSLANSHMCLFRTTELLTKQARPAFFPLEILEDSEVQRVSRGVQRGRPPALMHACMQVCTRMHAHRSSRAGWQLVSPGVGSPANTLRSSGDHRGRPGRQWAAAFLLLNQTSFLRSGEPECPGRPVVAPRLGGAWC